MIEGKLNLGAVAMGKAAYLQSLIDKLNTTTVGYLSARIDANDVDIFNISGRIDSNDVDIALINAKINTIASIFSIVFNADGTLNSEAYSVHKHSYIDSTIADTADGTGTQTDTTKTTTGVK